MKFRLEDQSWVASGTRLVKLSVLPPGMRLRSLRLLCNITGTKDAADALANTSFPLFISNVRLNPRLVDMSGLALQDLNKIMHGRDVGLGTAIPGSGTTFDITFVFEIPFWDPRQPTASDGAIPTEMLLSKSLEITFAAANIAGVGNLVATAGTVRVMADLIDGSSVPQLVELFQIDPGSQTIKLDPGVYQDLWITDGTGIGSVTPTEVTQVDLVADGVALLNNHLHSQLIADFNFANVNDAAGELGYATPRFLPIVIGHKKHGLLTKAVAIEQTGLLQIAGTMTAPRLCGRRIPLKDQATVEAVAAATGAPRGGVYEPAVASKSAIRAFDKSARQGTFTRKARLLSGALAGKVRLTPTPKGNPIG